MKSSFLKYQLRHYPIMRKEDIQKFIYQMNFGSGHFFISEDRVIEGIAEEIKGEDAHYPCLYEYLSTRYLRINIIPFLKYYSVDYLKDMFVKSNREVKGSGNTEPPHHSDIYKEFYRPHYRVVDAAYLTDDMRIKQLSYYLLFAPFSVVALESFDLAFIEKIKREVQKITVIDMTSFYNDGRFELKSYLKFLKESAIDHKKEGKAVLILGMYSYCRKARKYIDRMIYKVEDLFPRKAIKKYYRRFDFIAKADLLL